MIVANQTRNVQTPNINPIHYAQIAATPQMFKILSDSLYTQKELAVVRELLANAIDAHVVAGTTDTPINVHLPTLLEPWFQIDDYGTGLSPDAVFNIFQNYGFSDKTDSNDVIGGFGLGSKSPYALTDQYTVISRWNGTAYTFSAFLTESGAPGTQLVKQAPTTEPNGLSVMVPVSDVTGRFDLALCDLYPYVNHPLNVNIRNQLPAKFTGGKFSYTTQNGSTVHFDSTHDTDRAEAILGFVPYKFSAYEISQCAELKHFVAAKTLSEEQANLIHRVLDRFRYPDYHIRIVAPIGSLEVGVSRESLSMTTQTRKQLVETLVDALAQHYDAVTATLNSARTPYEWVKAAEILRLRPEIPAKWKGLIFPTGHRFYLSSDNICEKDHDPQLRATAVRSTSKKCGWRKLDDLNLAKFDRPIQVRWHEKSVGYSAYLDQYTWSDPPTPMLIFKGKEADVRALMDATGIPYEIEPLPVIRREAKARTYNGTKYDVEILHGPGRTGTDHLTADEFIKEIKDTKNPERVLIDLGHMYPLRSSHIRDFIEYKLIRPKYDRVIWFSIQKSHTKIRQTLTEDLTERGFVVGNAAIQSAFTVNETRYRRTEMLYNVPLQENLACQDSIKRLVIHHTDNPSLRNLGRAFRRLRVSGVTDKHDRLRRVFDQLVSHLPDRTPQPYNWNATARRRLNAYNTALQPLLDRPGIPPLLDLIDSQYPTNRLVIQSILAQLEN